MQIALLQHAFPGSSRLLSILIVYLFYSKIDLLFKTIVLPNLTYGLSVYGAYERDLNTVQNFLNRCHKRRFLSVPLNVKDIMHTQDKKLFSKAQ